MFTIILLIYAASITIVLLFKYIDNTFKDSKPKVSVTPKIIGYRIDNREVG